MSQTRIPLEVLRIEKPCPADWDAMVGDDRRRFCQGCQKYVHNLSAMPRAEAERLVCESAGDLCVQMTREADGAVVTVEYETAAFKRRRDWRYWTGIGLIGAAVAGLLHGAHSRMTVIRGGIPAGRFTVAGGIGSFQIISSTATSGSPAVSEDAREGPPVTPDCAITSQTVEDRDRETRNVLPPG